MAIVYRVNAPLTVPQLREIFEASGLKRPLADTARLRRMKERANFTVTAWDGKTLVGIARGLTDFAYCCYVSDLGVREGYQRRGIGKRMLRVVRTRLGEEVMVLLLSAPSAMEYYPKVGFERVENAWKVPRVR